MKGKGLFDIRDNLIIRLLRGSDHAIPVSTTLPAEEEKSASLVQTSVLNSSQRINSVRADFIYEFPFDSIADQKAFRETNNGLLYLLSIFHEANGDSRLQANIYDILKFIMYPMEENKKILISIIDDKEVSSKFFQKEITFNEFASWYYSPENGQKREEVENRIQKQISLAESKFLNNPKTVKNKTLNN